MDEEKQRNQSQPLPQAEDASFRQAQDVPVQETPLGELWKEEEGEKVSVSLKRDLDTIKAALEEVSRERDQFRSLLQRVQADFINYKRRADEEREEKAKYANSGLILKLLPVLDDFNLALDHAARTEADAPWLDGIKLIYRKLLSLLESEGVTKIGAEGKGFDPFEHEALAYQESPDHQEGQILMVVKDGFKMHGKVIRPAHVILAKKPEASQEMASSSEKEE